MTLPEVGRVGKFCNKIKACEKKKQIGAICISIRKQIIAIKKSLGLVKYMGILCGVMAVSICLAVCLFTKDFRTVTVSVDGELYEITTRAETVSEAIKDAGIVLATDDKINYDLTCNLDNVNDVISVSRPITLLVTMAGEEKIIKTYTDNISDALTGNGIKVDGSDVIHGGNQDGTASDGDAITVVIVSTKVVEEKADIPYETVYVEDSTLYKGESEVAVQGQNGSVTRKYSVKYEDGKEVSRELISEVKTQPVNKVVAVGTKVSFTTNRGFNDSYSKVFDMVATAYSPTPENWGYSTASGNRAREGVVAVDTRVIPLGTKLYIKSNVAGIPDYGYCIAWDVGGSIKNMRVDLFMESEDDCNRFGVRDVTVYVLEDQSVDVFALRG